MKAVDIIAEFANNYVFIEIKNFHDIARYDERTAIDPVEQKEKREALNHLKESLKYKFRDTLLYRFAEAKPEKPVHYICILNLAPSTLYGLTKFLSKELPVGVVNSRWKKPLAHSCFVINDWMFKKNFPKWGIEPINNL